jgi:hypothetical protein
MIDVHCRDCGRVLLGTRQIVSLASGAGGIDVAYICWCGRPGVERLGRAERRRRGPAEAVASGPPAAGG